MDPGNRPRYWAVDWLPLELLPLPRSVLLECSGMCGNRNIFLFKLCRDTQDSIAYINVPRRFGHLGVTLIDADRRKRVLLMQVSISLDGEVRRGFGFVGFNHNPEISNSHFPKFIVPQMNEYHLDIKTVKFSN